MEGGGREHAVALGDAHRAQAEAARLDVDRRPRGSTDVPARLEQLHHERIQPWRLCGPGARTRQLRVQSNRSAARSEQLELVLAGADIAQTRRVGRRLRRPHLRLPRRGRVGPPLCGPVQRGPDAVAHIAAGERVGAIERHVDAQARATVLGDGGGAARVVADRKPCWLGDQTHVPVHAREPPHVLALEVRAVMPTQHVHRERVRTW